MAGITTRGVVTQASGICIIFDKWTARLYWQAREFREAVFVLLGLDQKDDLLAVLVEQMIIRVDLVGRMGR